MSDLKWAVQNGDLATVKKCIEEEGIDVNGDLNGRFPIHYASDYGQAEVIDYLVSKGAKVNVTDKHGITPLLAAIWEGHTSAVKTLLSKGADKTGKTPDGQSYADVAEKSEIQALLKG
eukprot:Opistho-2@77028